MGDRHWIQLDCAHCGKPNPSNEAYAEDPMENGLYFAPSSGFMDFTCSSCGKLNWIDHGFHAVKVESKEQMDEWYKQEGFE